MIALAPSRLFAAAFLWTATVLVAGDAKVYAKPLDDGSWAVGLFNTGAEAATVTVNWSDLKLAGRQRVRDLWRQQDLGTFDEKFEAAVAPHGVVLVRFFPQR